MGSDIVPITNNEGQAALRKPGTALGGVRNFLVGTPANDERFNKVEAANDEGFGEGGAVNYIPGTMPNEKKYDTTGAIDVSFKEAPELRTTGDHPGVVVGDPVQIRETTGEFPGTVIGDPVEVKEQVTDPERAKEALGKLEKVKANRGGFLKGLRERMGATQEKMEAVAAKVGKAIEAYNKLEPKTKLAIGLTLTAGSMIGVASGATFLAGGIGLLRFAMKGASTVAMYQGLEGMLDKKYAELENVSEARKKFMKVGALATAAFVNFGLTDALANNGVTGKMVEGMAKIKDMAAFSTGPVSGNLSAEITDAAEGGWDEAVEMPTPEAGQGKEHWPETGPGKDTEYWPEKPLSVTDGLASNETVAPQTAQSTAPIAPSPVSGFDAASAPPVGSVEVGGDDGTLTGYKLPDGSFMDLDGKITADVSVPEVAAPVTEAAQPTPNKYDLGIEESFLKPEGGETLATSPEGVSPSTNMVLEDGTPVQSGVSTLENSATVAPEPASANEVPAKPVDAFVEADAVVAENTITSTSPSNQISFAPNATLSAQDMSSLSALNTLTGTEKFDTAITTAAQQIDSAKSFLSFGDGSDKIKESFITVLQNNPSVSVDALLTADTSNLSGREGASLKEAQGILKRVIPEDVLAQGSVRESSVVSVLQNNFTA